jgi:hypothetical protein
MESFKSAVSQIIRSTQAQTQRPLVVFDLDGTLFDVSYRTLEILRRFAEQKDIRQRFATELAMLEKLDPSDFKYSLEQNLNHVGITRHSERGAEFIHLAETLWFKSFFRDEFVLFDRPYAGAADCVHWFLNQGAHIIYLSGRDVPNMSRGTLQALERDGFPHNGPHVSMILKPDYNMDDLIFKRQSIETIQSEGTVIAAFDNEPANVQLFIDQFPNAWSIHYKSAHAKPLPLSGPRFKAISHYGEIGF